VLPPALLIDVAHDISLIAIAPPMHYLSAFHLAAAQDAAGISRGFRRSSGWGALRTGY